MTDTKNEQAVDKKDQDAVGGNEQTEKEAAKPKGMIRPAGIATLAILVGGVGAGTYFFADSLAHYGITTALAKSIGAEANIEEVKVDWHPLGLKINSLQQTDPASPQTNLFQFESASLKMNLGELLLGKYIISDISVTGLKFGSARNTPGSVFKALEDTETGVQKQETSATADESSGLDIPSVDELLAKADLLTEKKARALEKVWAEEKVAVQQAIDALPDKSRLKKYAQDWRAIKNIKIKSVDDLNLLKQKLKQLKSDVKADKSSLKVAKAQVKASRKELDVAYKELKAAPKQDWQNIKQQLPIDDPNAIAISRVLFGEEIAGYLETAQKYYLKAKPYIDAHKEVKDNSKISAGVEQGAYGENIEFALEKPYPDWLVENLEMSAQVSAQDTYKVGAQNITAQTYILGKPATYQIASVGTKQQEPAFELGGKYSIAQTGMFSTDGEWQLNGHKLSPKSLSKSKNLTVKLEEGAVNGIGSYSYTDELNSKSKLNFVETKFDGSSDSEIADLTLNTLKGVKTFDLDVSVTGKLDSPDTSIRSNLDNRLNKAFKQAVKQRWTQVEDDTKQALASKLQNSLDLNNAELAKLQDMDLNIDNIEVQLKNYGQGKLDKIVKDKQKKYEEEVKAKAKAELKKQENKLKDKLQDKLKDKLKDFKCCEE